MLFKAGFLLDIPQFVLAVLVLFLRKTIWTLDNSINIPSAIIIMSLMSFASIFCRIGASLRGWSNLGEEIKQGTIFSGVWQEWTSLGSTPTPKPVIDVKDGQFNVEEDYMEDVATTTPFWVKAAHVPLWIIPPFLFTILPFFWIFFFVNDENSNSDYKVVRDAVANAFWSYAGASIVIAVFVWLSAFRPSSSRRFFLSAILSFLMSLFAVYTAFYIYRMHHTPNYLMGNATCGNNTFPMWTSFSSNLLEIIPAVLYLLLGLSLVCISPRDKRLKPNKCCICG